jgi:hypothetical protein
MFRFQWQDGGMNVRRLAAIDMWGRRGTILRRRIVLAEFVIGAAGVTALGGWVVTSQVLAGQVLGAWMIGAGLNYVPLAAHALALSRAGALEAELAGVDVGREARRYGVFQALLVVPLSLVVLSLRRTP